MRTGRERVAPEEFHIEVYDGEVWLGRLYVDHWVNGCVVVEDKAVTHPMGNREVAQVVAYLAALGAPVGLRINFGRPSLEFRRSLPPKTTAGWQAHIQLYLWRPDWQPDPQNAHRAKRAPSAKSVVKIR